MRYTVLLLAYMYVSQVGTKHDEDCSANTHLLPLMEQTASDICSPGFV